MAGVYYLMKLFSRARLLVIVAGWVIAALQARAAETHLIAFALESHDKQDYTKASWTGRPLLVLVSTRDAAPHNAGRVWSDPLVAAVTAASADVVLLRVATLPGGIPRLFAGLVRDAVAPADGDPIRISLLDWDNVFAQSYELPGDSYNVLLFDREGALAYRTELRAFSKQQLDGVLGELQAAAGRL
jgi:hypothetical protein